MHYGQGVRSGHFNDWRGQYNFRSFSSPIHVVANQRRMENMEMRARKIFINTPVFFSLSNEWIYAFEHHFKAQIIDKNTALIQKESDACLRRRE